VRDIPAEEADNVPNADTTAAMAAIDLMRISSPIVEFLNLTANQDSWKSKLGQLSELGQARRKLGRQLTNAPGRSTYKDQVGDRAAIKAAVETYLSDHLEK